jgi:hypothetical protein
MPLRTEIKLVFETSAGNRYEHPVGVVHGAAHWPMIAEMLVAHCRSQCPESEWED